MATRPITITNGSFEASNLADGDWDNNVQGWTKVGYGGSYDADPNYFDESSVTGENVAWVYSDGGSISQTTPETYDSDATYTFDMALGDEYGSSNANFTLNIYAGSTLIGTTSGTTASDDSLDLFTVSSSGYSDASLNGQPIRIEIIKDSGAELLVDHVRGYVITSPDGVVDGEDTGELMELGYDDADGLTDGGGDLITTGDDVIVGGGGNDTISGDGGADTIFGDSQTGPTGSSGGERVHFAWDDIPDPDNGGSIDTGDEINSGVQTVGNVDVTYTTATNAVEFDGYPHYVAGIDAGSGSANAYSKASLEVSSTMQLAFSTAVEDISFRINDLENNLETLVVRAYDASGQPTSYNVSLGSNVSASDTDAVAGVDRFVGTDSASDTSASGSVLFTMPGPISRIEIDYVNNGGTLVVSDIYFDNPPEVVPGGNDDISGGDGADVIDGGEGNDTLDGDGGDDQFVISSGSDVIDGGTETDTYTAIGSTTLDDETIEVTVDNSGTGTVQKAGDGTTDTVTSVERFIADEVGGQTDVITITEELISTNVSGLSDASRGIFTPKDGSPAIAFGGPGQPTINQILSGTYDPGTGPVSLKGSYQITMGEEDGAQLGNIYAQNFETLNFKVVCFARGTLIDTLCGPRAIETLTDGMLVWTAQSGYRPIRWIGSKTVPARGAMAPVRFEIGTVGNDRALWVSPQHRMLMSGWQVELLFGQPQVLAPAKALVNGSSVQIVEGGEVEYHHLLFDKHEIIRANGALSESFHPGEQGMDSLSAPVRAEILELFPNLSTQVGSFGPSAVPGLKVREAALLAPPPKGAGILLRAREGAPLPA